MARRSSLQPEPVLAGLVGVELKLATYGSSVGLRDRSPLFHLTSR
jgi:hypothetical protein